ncbi:MAG: GNAT family N-acetyltransferase [Bryobacteraceae bacterium]
MLKQAPGNETGNPDRPVVGGVSRNDLDAFFRPKSVALIGATEKPDHVGRAILWNLLSSPFGGTIYPVNPKRAAVLGVKSYAAIGAVPERVDLAVIATPAASVPDIVRDCADAGVRGGIVISAGFRETGEQGAELERQVLVAARSSGMCIMGPNCLGIMCPVTGLNATFARSMARPGNVAVVSQSGAICTAMLDWSLGQGIGFSALLSTGSMIDVGWDTLIGYLGDDPHTRSIVVYMESAADARSFLSAARQVALSKPILVIKAGRTELAAKAAASHTGSMTGSDAVWDAAFRRVGVLRMRELSEVFQMTEVLSTQPLPRGPRLTIVTNAGGPGVLATDALLAAGGQLATLSDDVSSRLSGVLPKHWSHSNPVDLIGDARPDRYEQAIEILSQDPNSDGLLVILTPQATTDPSATATKITHSGYRKAQPKPIFASWMGGNAVAEGNAILSGAGIPTFAFPDSAARAFHDMWRYSYNLRALYETPISVRQDLEAAAAVSEMIDSIRRDGRHLLTEFEAKRVMAAYGIPTVETVLAPAEDDAAAAAERLGFPVVVKLHSHTITHKAEVGGVKLSLINSEAARDAFREIRRAVTKEDFQGVTIQPMISRDGYELILGSSVDREFGPVLMFGVGGRLVETLEDHALGLPPLNTTLARRLMEQTRIHGALTGRRGKKPVNVSLLEELLVRFSQLVLEQKWIREIDMNPILVSTQDVIVLDARVILYSNETNAADIVRPAIKPYPSKYVSDRVLADGTALRIRPIRPEDEPLMVRFQETLSEQSVHRRYFMLAALASRTSHESLTRICFIDYDREIALIAELCGKGESGSIVGVGGLRKDLSERGAEISLIVSDKFQRRGIGKLLLESLIQVGEDEGLESLAAEVLPENHPMHNLLAKYGFSFQYSQHCSMIGIMRLAAVSESVSTP